jgi:beta-lactamase class A
MPGSTPFARFVVVVVGFAFSAALGACAPFGATPPVPAPSPAGVRPASRAVTLPAATPSPAPSATRIVASSEAATSTPIVALTATPPTLEDVVDSIIAEQPATVGFYTRNLETGEVVSANADRQVRSASLYKLFVLYSTYAQLTSGQISSSETISLSHAAFVGDPYNEWPEGTSTTVGCALQYMIEVSSNSAAEMLLERVGGQDRVNADMKALGLTQSEISDDYAFTSAADIARLLDLILTKRAVNPAASSAMLQLLLQQRRNDRLPSVLPPGMPVAHKTGELTNLRNDAGIVFAPAGPYIFVALVSNAENEGYARDTIQSLSRAVYAAFESGGVPSYDGLPPRLASEIFQVPDAQGRLAPIDEWNELVSVASRGVGLTTNADATFWVDEGYVPPRGIDTPMVNPTDSVGCPVAIPPQTPVPTVAPAQTWIAGSSTPAPSPTPIAPPHASQQWLGTVVSVSDRFGGPPTGDFASTATGQWLLLHSWEYGFIPALPETPAGGAQGYEPWELRWVGRDMARQIHGLDPTYRDPTIVTAQLQTAEADLAAQATKNRELLSGGK